MSRNVTQMVSCDAPFHAVVRARRIMTMTIGRNQGGGATQNIRLCDLRVYIGMAYVSGGLR